jgi:IS605 OrfB family transposase
MKINSSYSIAIKGENKVFKETVSIYRKAVAFLIRVVDENYDELTELEGKNKNGYIEKLVHTTKANTAIYDFDKHFYKLPTYYRRAAIARALGIVSSYRSNYANWEANGKEGKPPRLTYNHFVMPMLYHDGSFVRTGEYKARIKIFRKGDWVWLPVKLNKSDADYINRHWSGAKQSAPALEKRNRRYALRFAFEEKVELKEDINTVCAVDLNISSNVCAMAIVGRDGTVLGRKVVKLSKEIDHLERAMGFVKKAQKKAYSSEGSGKNLKMPRLWKIVNSKNKALTHKTATKIMAYAEKMNVDAIVFETLNTNGKKYGPKASRLTLWRWRKVQDICTLHAHRKGIHISTVITSGTSQYAFDGSGKVKRGSAKTGYVRSLVEFTTGKIYHADINAALNIGARYFVRDILKTMPETVWSALKAKVPLAFDWLTCNLSDLINLNAALPAISEGEC